MLLPPLPAAASERTAPPRPPVAALMVVAAPSPFAINAIVPSMPALEIAFRADYARVQLVLSLFLASVALAQIVIGPLSDRYGRRPVMLGGFMLFVAASAAAPFAPGIDALIFIRLLQGAGGCVGIVLSRAIVRDVYERRQAASMLGYVTMGLAVAPMVAPLIGGFLQEQLGWTAVFWFMAALGGGCLAITWLWIPETNLRPTARLDLATSFRVFGQLLRMPDFLLFTASTSLTTGVFFTFLGGAPYVSERILGLSPSVYGLWFGTIALGYATGNFLAGRFTDRFGVARMIMGGTLLAFAAASLPPLLFAAGLVRPETLFLPMALVGIANGIALPSAVSGAVSVRPDIAGAAAGLSGSAQIGTGALLAAVGGAAVAGGSSAMPVFAVMLGTALLALWTAAAIYRRNRP